MQNVQTDAPLRRIETVRSPEIGGFNSALAWIGAAVLLVAIAFILGATLLT